MGEISLHLKQQEDGPPAAPWGTGDSLLGSFMFSETLWKFTQPQEESSSSL